MRASSCRYLGQSAAPLARPPFWLLHFGLPNADDPQPKGERGRRRMRRVEAANRLLTRAALNLVPEFPATFDRVDAMESRPR